MATKKEMVKELVENYNYKESDIRNLKNTELEELLAKEKAVEYTDSVAQECNDVGQSDVNVTQKCDNVTQLKLFKYQPKVNEYKIFYVPANVKKVNVSVGYGGSIFVDMFDGTGNISLTEGEDIDFSVKGKFSIKTASRPVLSITYYG